MTTSLDFRLGERTRHLMQYAPVRRTAHGGQRGRPVAMGTVARLDRWNITGFADFEATLGGK
jgi:hypothetical protein